MQRKTITSFNLSDRTRYFLEKITTEYGITMTNAMNDAVEFYYRNHTLQELIHDIYSYKGQLIERIGSIEGSPIQLLREKQKDKAIELLDKWIGICRDKGFQDLVVEGKRLANRLQVHF